MNNHYQPHRFYCAPGEAFRIVEFKQGKRTRRVSVRSTSAEDALKKAREAYPHTYQWGFKCLSVDSTPIK